MNDETFPRRFSKALRPGSLPQDRVEAMWAPETRSGSWKA